MLLFLVISACMFEGHIPYEAAFSAASACRCPALIYYSASPILVSHSPAHPQWGCACVRTVRERLSICRPRYDLYPSPIAPRKRLSARFATRPRTDAKPDLQRHKEMSVEGVKFHNHERALYFDGTMRLQYSSYCG